MTRLKVQRSTRPNVHEWVREHLVDVECIDPKLVRGGAHFVHDLGFEELDYVELVMAAEETFGIEVPEADADNVHTVQEFEELIQRALDV